MRHRLAQAAALLVALFATLFAAAATAVPSYAATAVATPDCATSLQNAATGAASSCSTQGPPAVECSGCGVRRTVNIAVTKGAVDATLVCDGLTYAAHVDGPGTGTIGAWGGQNCTVTLTSTADGTVAAATSTASYVFATA